MVAMDAQPRLGWATVVSAAAHVLLLAMAARFPGTDAPRPVHHVELIAVSLIGTPGGSPDDGGASAPGPEVASPPPPIAASAPPPAPPPIVAKRTAPPIPRAPSPKQVVTRPKAVSTPRPSETEAARRPAAPSTAPPAAATGEGQEQASASGRGAGTRGEGTGAGRPGTGGRGTGSGGGEGRGDARVAYAANPRPEYPLIARRMGMEGVVLLSVLVRRDGDVGDIDVQQSSGFPALDDAALRTVRSRWRFVPARKDGEAVDARVTVPIRFRLSDEG